MRFGNLTGQEILDMEMAADKKRRDRRNGFSLGQIRDRGWIRLTNGSVMEWPTERPDFAALPDFVTWKRIKPGTFMLDGKSYDAEEFRKWIRWA